MTIAKKNMTLLNNKGKVVKHLVVPRDGSSISTFILLLCFLSLSFCVVCVLFIVSIFLGGGLFHSCFGDGNGWLVHHIISSK